jgi:hypothetical protein
MDVISRSVDQTSLVALLRHSLRQGIAEPLEPESLARAEFRN